MEKKERTVANTFAFLKDYYRGDQSVEMVSSKLAVQKQAAPRVEH